MCNNCFKQTNKNKKRHDQQQTLHWEHLHANKHIYLLFNHHFQHWEHLHANSHLKYGYVFSLDQTSKQTTLKVIHVYEEKQTYRARISLSLSLSLSQSASPRPSFPSPLFVISVKWEFGDGYGRCWNRVLARVSCVCDVCQKLLLWEIENSAFHGEGSLYSQTYKLPYLWTVASWALHALLDMPSSPRCTVSHITSFDSQPQPYYILVRI